MNTSSFGKKSLIGLSLLTAGLAGCSVQSKTSQEQAAEITRQLTYVKDSHGICYATIGSFSYGGHIVTSITAISCKDAGL